jgi:hypothetical protein
MYVLRCEDPFGVSLADASEAPPTIRSSHTLGDVQVQQAGPPRTDAASSTSEQYNVALRERGQLITEQQDASTALGKVFLLCTTRQRCCLIPRVHLMASTLAALQI